MSTQPIGKDPDQMRRVNRDVIDHDVIDSLKNGDHMSYNRIYLKYYDAIYRFVHALVKSSAAADDISQDVFVKLWEKRDKLDPSKNFNGLIYRMARNSAIDHLKAESRLNDTQPIGDFDIPGITGSDDPVMCKDIDLLICLAVEQMPSQRKKIFQMTYRDGLSAEEIAARLSLKKHYVQKQISMSRAEIRQLLTFMIALLMLGLSL